MAPIRCTARRRSIRPDRSMPRSPSTTASIGAVADPTLMARLEHQAGRAALRRQCQVRNRAPRSTNEPDKLAGGIGFGPRLMVSEAALARHRPVAAGQPGALALPAAPAGERRQRCRRQGGDRAGARRVSAGRLGDPQPQQCLAAARARRRALHPVSHHRRPDRAAGRRRRRRQCGEKPSRPQARRHRHHEGARRQRPPRVRASI